MHTAFLGVICLDSNFPKPRGHIRHDATFAFPTRNRVVTGVNVERLINRASADLLEPFERSARELEAQGAAVIAGSCGFLARYQQEIAGSVKVPVITSSLLQIPLVEALFGRASIGVITADSERLTDAHFQGVGACSRNLHIAGLQSYPVFRRAILEDEAGAYDWNAIRQEVLECCSRMLARQPGIRGIILECTDLSPFRADIRQAFARPVFDIVALAIMTYRSATGSNSTIPDNGSA